MRQNEKAREKAEQHWKFLERWLHMIYVDAYVRGFKHGAEYAHLVEEENPT